MDELDVEPEDPDDFDALDDPDVLDDPEEPDDPDVLDPADDPAPLAAAPEDDESDFASLFAAGVAASPDPARESVR